jgi:hypothetical protein
VNTYAIGVWGGPVGVAVGVLVGGALGALLGDHAYVAAAGTADPMTRSLAARFTGLWTDVYEEGLVRALVTEHRMNPAFVERVFRRLNDNCHTDADDAALLHMEHLRRDPALAQALSPNPLTAGALPIKSIYFALQLSRPRDETHTLFCIVIRTRVELGCMEIFFSSYLDTAEQ